MDLATILWGALLVVLAGLFVVTLRRMSALIARTRDLERLQAAVADIDRRFGAAADPLVTALDDARRRAADPAVLADQVAATQVAIEDLRRACRALPAPAPLAALPPALAGDVDRAARAVSLLEHGVGAMAGRSLNRDLEAQTSLKRGTLNLRHARDAFALRAREVARLRPADLAPGADLRGSVAAATAIYPAMELEEADRTFEPSM